MRVKKIQIEDDVMKVLQLGTIDGNTFKLPPGQLERDLYTRVDKVLRAAGGKWNRRIGAHEFPSSPAEALTLDQGEVLDIKQTYQIFETHPNIAAFLVGHLHLPPNSLVLEPSAGSGQLVRALVGEGHRVLAVEIRPECAEGVMLAGAQSCVTADFLSVAPVEKVDAVLMNPPFTGGQDVAHVEHALKFLRPGGILISIMSAGVMINKQHAAFRERIQQMRGEFTEFAANSFQHAGTSVNTVWLRVKQD